MNAKTHSLPTGSMQAALEGALARNPDAQVVKVPDVIGILEHAAPGKDGLPLVYSLLGGLEMRIARLAGMVTNVMASKLREDDASIDKFNDAMAALDEAETRRWAFEQAGLLQRNMIDELRGLINFRLRVADYMTGLTGQAVAPRWADTIELAAQPMPVADWKLEFSWDEYLESCGKDAPEMTKDEFYKLMTSNLSSKRQVWGDHVHQVMALIESLEGEAIEFDELPLHTQLRLLESLGNEDKEKRLRTNALKMARTPAELHVRRAFISSFCQEVREAANHHSYASLKANEAGALV